MTARVLLTVSGTIPACAEEEMAEGVRPRLDYLEIARAAGADLMDVERARRETGRVGAVVRRVGGVGPLIAWACFRVRRDYDVVLTDGEQVGLPLAALFRVRGGRRPRHSMIVHILSVRKKVVVFKALRLRAKIDQLIVYASRQRDFAIQQLGVEPAAVVLSSFMVDTDFWAPRPLAERGTICAAGLEFRDYPTLIEAVRGLDVRCVIAAGSRWSKRRDTTHGVELPANVEVCSLDYLALRELYAASEFVVMPLYDVEFQAGVTTILEAMSMGKAVVCSRSRGQTDVIVHDETGIMVPPGDVPAMRAAITALLGDPETATRLGQRARDAAVESADVREYARRVAAALPAPTS